MSIFQEQQTPTSAPTSVEDASNPVASSAATPEVKADPFADLLGTVTNDRGEQKYASTPEALKGLSHSQEHIRKLEEEMSQMRVELEKRKSVEDAIQSFTPTPEPTPQPVAGMDEEAVAGIVQQRLTEIEQQKATERNTKLVVDSIQKQFGDKAEEVFYGKAKELGMTQEQFNRLAAQSPNAVLAWFNVAPQHTPSVSSGSINTAAMRDEPKPIPTILDGGEERISLPAASKSLLMGATHGDLMTEMKRHREAVYAKYGLSL